MISVLCALTLVLWQQEPATGQVEKPQPRLMYHVQMPDRNLRLYDRLLVKVTVSTDEDEPVAVPKSVLTLVSHKLTSSGRSFSIPGGSTGNYSFDYGTEEPTIIRMVPSVTRQRPLTISLRRLPVPLMSDAEHSFWREISSGGCTFETHLVLPPETPRSVETGITDGLRKTLSISERPQEEMKFLEALFAEARKVEPKLPPDENRPGLVHFGWGSSLNEELTDKLLDYEENLSPGTLRNSVRFTKLLRRIYDAPTDADRLAVVDELIDWLDSLRDRETKSSVEREVLADEVVNWRANYYPDEHAYHKLLYECTERLPSSFGQDEDYRSSRRSWQPAKKFPGYREYFTEREAERRTE